MPTRPGNPFQQVARFLGSSGRAVPRRPGREQGLGQAARGLGLEFRHRDVRDLESTVRFPSTLTGAHTGVENVLSGTWEGLPVRVFDRWRYEDETDERTHRTRRVWYRHSCVHTRVALRAPEPFQLEREDLLTRFADRIGVHDIELELEDFNRAYTVRCEDRKFATDLIDQRMMAWLLETKDEFPSDVMIQIDRRQLLLTATERKPGDLVPLLRLVKDFIGHVPPVAYSLWGVGVPSSPASDQPTE